MLRKTSEEIIVLVVMILGLISMVEFVTILYYKTKYETETKKLKEQIRNEHTINV